MTAIHRVHCSTWNIRQLINHNSLILTGGTTVIRSVIFQILPIIHLINLLLLHLLLNVVSNRTATLIQFHAVVIMSSAAVNVPRGTIQTSNILLIALITNFMIPPCSPMIVPRGTIHNMMNNQRLKILDTQSSTSTTHFPYMRDMCKPQQTELMGGLLPLIRRGALWATHPTRFCHFLKNKSFIDVPRGTILICTAIEK